MTSVMRSTWPLLLGMLLLMIGNGMQGTLLGIRGGIEGIPTFQMSVVMSGYFGGFLLGSLVVPGVIKNVGHVRVFAALGSLISAAVVLYSIQPDWIVWTLLRVMVGFCFCGVYITAESWLNASSTNENRGQALAAYMITQLLGIVIAQGLLNIGDPAGYLLFIIPSVLVSLAFTPILLTARPAPNFETIKRMSFARLYDASPLGCVGVFLMGGVFSALAGMSSVWGASIGLSVAQISLFVAAIYSGGLVLQYPLGWVSDRWDRRRLVLILSAVGALTTLVVVVVQPGTLGLVVAGAIMGGVANPIYAVLLAYTNDYLDQSDMAAASAGLLFIYGVGSFGGPLITGWMMAQMGPSGFWAYMGVLMLALAIYAGWRMTRRRALTPDEQGNYAVITPGNTQLVVGAALDDAQSSGQADAQDAPPPAA
ncbi:MAG: MFS transporter [Paracoccus sp. (in: a-proteobacteria)]|jgi:MFS family permease|uniref:MFS transporter n=1 Tax=unclassified Paracoccus (in: a-proteobacteria) TaxID=2688777 RepID=UPI000C457624|nr:MULTISPECIES: MFS transporter [unclassified Paracoccus (in: a-proteobacteria)]MAN57440.1 MFS transporter [Paracoccus sp. (in: a-proteobacteria)]MBA50228.1 MFS transporter [Paracoccus sp. (in: a-proteobacteria)]|tara:strand:+ start:1489 stop:2760 length:1272 start_codon:yes stop_codon:yes gene_type:complete